MRVNGWMGLAFDLRRADETEPDRAELRRAFKNATHEGLLGALRDARTPDGELLETAARLAALYPPPC